MKDESNLRHDWSLQSHEQMKNDGIKTRFIVEFFSQFPKGSAPKRVERDPVINISLSVCHQAVSHAS